MEPFTELGSIFAICFEFCGGYQLKKKIGNFLFLLGTGLENS